MKNFTIALLVILSGCTNSKSIQLVDEPEKPVFTISLSATRYNILWLHLDNDLILNLPNNENQKWEVSTDNGNIEMWSIGNIKTKPTKTGQATISCFTIDPNGDKKLHATFMFRVKDLPRPTIFLGNDFEDATIPKETLVKLEKLECRIPYFEYNLQYDILSFDLIIVKGENNVHIANQGALFSEELKNVLKTVDSGDKPIFTNITATRKDGEDVEQVNSKVILLI